ncbi:arginine--tRNA ligase [Candidatus Gracilibacteria bacterium]|nr:arginine--tRNA ligase [Candidatus Gracilibacteria bacterium]MCF7819514.1 arginine--tRNA ligase [Candidatus Gracilibacteria bacterium]
MQELVRQYLTRSWDAEKAERIQFSAVPKGQFGDLALSFFELAKTENVSPVQIAQEVQKILTGSNFVEETKGVGPYLNISFDLNTFFVQVLNTPLYTEFSKGKTIVLEFSGPNTNKPLHLGHMRNHALGIAVANLLGQSGATVHRVNIINDRGVHICKSMLAYQRWGQDETPEKTGEKPDHFVGRYYVKFEQEAKKDESLKNEIQNMLVQWESGDPKVRELWEKMSHWALTGHEKTYARQGVEFEKEYRESEHYQSGVEAVQEGFKKGVFQKREDGTLFIDLSEEGLDEKVVLRADGTAIYLTQDIGLAKLRYDEFHPDEMIYVVADEQNYHFQVLFLCLEKLGLLDKKHLHHLGYGLVNLPHGRMKSREGTVVDADNLMDDLSNLALTEIKKRNPDLSQNEAQKIAEQIMNAAWKFYLLTTNPRKTITFNPEQSIAFEGATGPYLQYAGVRMKSIFKKAGSSLESNKESVGFLEKAEKPLGRKILEFPDVLDRSAEQKNPTYLVTYLLELAQTWSSYYSEHSILKAETDDLKKARLALAHKVYNVLEAGLGILGIEIPEVM